MQDDQSEKIRLSKLRSINENLKSFIIRLRSSNEKIKKEIDQKKMNDIREKINQSSL